MHEPINKLILTSDEIFEEFYRLRNTTKRHIYAASNSIQKEFLDDVYHDSLIVAHRRKTDNQERTFSLCMFSGYTTTLRIGFYKNLLKEEEFNFIDIGECFLTSEGLSPYERIEFIEKLKLSIEALSILFLYGNTSLKKGVEALIKTYFTSNKETLASIGRVWGVSRERARQLCEIALSEVRYLLDCLYVGDEYTEKNKSSMLRNSGFSIYDYRNIVSKIPMSRQVECLLYEEGLDGIDAMISHLISICVHSSDHDVIFDRYVVLGLLTEVVVMPTENKNIFLSVPNTPITIWYKSEYDTIDICYGREGLFFFEKTDKGWIDTKRYDDSNSDFCGDTVYYSSIKEVIDDSVLDFLSESLEEDEYKQSEAAIESKFFNL